MWYLLILFCLTRKFHVRSDSNAGIWPWCQIHRKKDDHHWAAHQWLCESRVLLPINMRFTQPPKDFQIVPTQESPLVLRLRPHDRPALDHHVAAEAHCGFHAHPHVGPVPEEDGAVVRRVGKQILLGRRLILILVLSKHARYFHMCSVKYTGSANSLGCVDPASRLPLANSRNLGSTL